VYCIAAIDCIAMDNIVKGLLNGKRPPEEYFSGEKSEQLAAALSARIAAGVAPSLCAHAMCGSASVGNVAVVRMLSTLPMSKFNKAYNFSEPLRRAIRPYLKKVDDPRRDDYRECAKILVAAGAGLHRPDKNSPSGNNAARILKEDGSPDALQLLKELEDVQKGLSGPKDDAASHVVEEPKKGMKAKQGSERKRKSAPAAAEGDVQEDPEPEEIKLEKRAKKLLYSIL
jgi:hypothetical protein